MNELTIKNFDTLEVNELETIDGDLLGGTITGSIIGGAIGAVGGVITGGANGAIGGWLGGVGVSTHIGMGSPI